MVVVWGRVQRWRLLPADACGCGDSRWRKGLVRRRAGPRRKAAVGDGADDEDAERSSRRDAVVARGRRAAMQVGGGAACKESVCREVCRNG